MTSVHESSIRKYRFWPIYAIAFARCFGYNIYNLALPNYLIYFQHINASLVGLIIASYALAFVFGPLIGLPITKKIGSKNAVIFSSIVSVIFVGFQVFILDPILLIVLRALDGLTTGFFWPNLQMEISNWQRNSPREIGDNYFQTYAMSWNFGNLFGGIVGFFIVFIGGGNEMFALIFSWISIITMVPCAFAIESHDSKLTFHEGKAVVKYENDPRNGALLKLLDPERQPKSEDPNAITLLKFPALFYLFGTLIYAYLKAFYPLAVPIIFEKEHIASYFVYIITFFHQIVQMIAATLVTRRSPKVGYYAWLFSMVVNIISSIILWIIAPGWIIAIIFVVNGFLSGLLYNFTSKIMLQYGASTGSLKYVTLYEFCNGIGFGFAPLLVGFIADINMMYNFVLLWFLVTFMLIILLYLGRKGQKAL